MNSFPALPDEQQKTVAAAFQQPLASNAASDESHQLPGPATYVIDNNGVIRAAYAEKDYTKRMEPEDLILALNAL